MADPRSVLVTRPAAQSAPLCTALRDAGYRPHSLPLLDLEPISELPPRQRQLLLDLDQFQHLIFISGNAVRFGMARVEDFWPQLPACLSWYGIGGVTAAALADYGVIALQPAGDMTSEALLRLPELQAVSGQRVLIFKGEGGRDTLRRELLARGATVEELVCYRRLCPPMRPGALAAQLEQWQVGTILLSSGEGLANMLRLLSPEETLKLRDISMLVPSARVARQAESAGFTRVAVAENASDAAMLRALAGQAPGTGEH